MKLINKEMSTGQVQLSIEVDNAILDRHLNKTQLDIAKTAKIPGFRLGKVPPTIINRYYGRQKLLEQSMDNIAAEVIPAVLKEHDIEPFYTPQVTVKKIDPLILSALVILKPTVKVGDYTDISVDIIPKQVTTQMVEETINNLRNTRMDWERVTEPVKIGDLVNIVSSGFVKHSNGNISEFLAKNERSYLASSDNVHPLPGFAQQLEGMQTGETCSFVLTIPDGYSDQSLVGQNVEFTVKLNTLQRKKLPPLDNEFAKNLGIPNVENVKQMQEFIENSLQEQYKTEWEKESAKHVLQQLVARCEFAISPLLIQMESEYLLEEQKKVLQRNQISYEDYLARMRLSSEENQQQALATAELKLKEALAIKQFVEIEGIQSSEDEINEELIKLKEQEQLNSESSLEDNKQIVSDILDRRATISTLISNYTNKQH